MATGNVTGQEELSTPTNVERETIRNVSEASTTGACTIYSIQAVVGLATPGCAIVGIDYGRRP
jgi:hypothetical protein